MSLDAHLSWRTVAGTLARCMGRVDWPPLNPDRWPCISWGLHCHYGHPQCGGLLLRRFTITTCVVVYFLLHFPLSCLSHPLGGTLSYCSSDFPQDYKPCDHPSHRFVILSKSNLNLLLAFKCLDQSKQNDYAYYPIQQRKSNARK